MTLIPDAYSFTPEDQPGALANAVAAFATALTIFAPSLILSTILGWSLFWTNLALGSFVVVYTAAGGSKPATVSAGGDDDAWYVGALAGLDVPILQGLCLTSSRES